MARPRRLTKEQAVEEITAFTLVPLRELLSRRDDFVAMVRAIDNELLRRRTDILESMETRLGSALRGGRDG